METPWCELHAKCTGSSQIRKHSVMVWDGISVDSHTNLVIRDSLTAREYIKQVLMGHMVAAAYGVGPEFFLITMMSGCM